MNLTPKTRTGTPADVAGFTGPIEDLNIELAYRRQVEDAGRADELERLRAVAEHERARADVAESTRLAELDRGERG